MALHRPKTYAARGFEPIADLPIRLYGKVKESVVDGPGFRYVIFVQGCPHGCEGCHNPGSHDVNGGTISSTSELWREIEALPHLQGITFSGGEPFLWAGALAEIGKAARNRGLSVMTYSGFTYERLLELAKTKEDVHALLTVTNYLVDGPFILAERDITLPYRGSRNQRILDITCYPNTTAAASADFA